MQRAFAGEKAGGVELVYKPAGLRCLFTVVWNMT